jgi:hypothetical protein
MGHGLVGDLIHVCRQAGRLSEGQAFVGFAAYKYRAGFGLIPNLKDAFKPVSTAFAISSASNTSAGFAYEHLVESCKATCPDFEPTTWLDESHVGVSSPSRFDKQRSRDELNILTRL